MNPGYKGRAELPENLKALFRPCAMCVPDLMNICEIMLSAEGFLEAKDLAKKFVTLYRLNKQLLSACEHYDWGLRAVKSVLVVAGELKRGDPSIDERRTLMRALRDTNMAKLSKDDIYVFMKLISALFPNLEVAVKVCSVCIVWHQCPLSTTAAHSLIEIVVLWLCLHPSTDNCLGQAQWKEQGKAEEETEVEGQYPNRAWGGGGGGWKPDRATQAPCELGVL